MSNEKKREMNGSERSEKEKDLSNSHKALFYFPRTFLFGAKRKEERERERKRKKKKEEGQERKGKETRNEREEKEAAAALRIISHFFLS